VPPQVAFHRAGVQMSLFEHPENRIGHEAIGRLLSVCSTLTRRNDFGLMIVTHSALRDLGALGELMRHSATVGEALRVLMLHLNFHDRLAVPLMLRMESASVFLGYSVQHPEMEGTPQIYDSAITIAFRILRELCGPQWKPGLVQFSHSAPANRIRYRRIFGPRLFFDAEWSGIYFDASWLDKDIAGADRVRYRQLSQELTAAWAGDLHSFCDDVQNVLHQLLLNGTANAPSVARLYGISDRTLRYRLRKEGTSMQELLAAARFGLSRHLLKSTQLSMSKIAACLCYSDAAVFSRAFHGWSGVGPGKWRAAQTSRVTSSSG